MKLHSQTYLTLPESIRRMAGMASARTGKSLSEYVSELVLIDCRSTGVASLVVTDSDDAATTNTTTKEDCR